MPFKTDLPYKDEFLLSLQNNNYSIETVNSYERDLDILHAFLHIRKTEFLQFDKLILSEYKGFLRNDNYTSVLKAFKEGKEVEIAKQEISPKKLALYKGQLSSRSVNRMLSAMRSYFGFLVDIDQPVPLPPSAIKLIKTEKKEKQVAELPELINLIEAPMEYEKNALVKLRNRAILELIFSTGMRISEVINLNRDQIKYRNGIIEDDRVYIMGKGKKQRFVYLTPRSVAYLQDYLVTRQDDYPAMFIPGKGTRRATGNPYLIRLSQNYLQMKISEYRRLCGIIVPTSAHSLRHGFATYLAEEGASAVAIQKLLGHESLQTTTRYVHASDKFAEQAHREHHPLINKVNKED